MQKHASTSLKLSMGLYLEQYDYEGAHELCINNYNGYFFVSQNMPMWYREVFKVLKNENL